MKKLILGLGFSCITVVASPLLDTENSYKGMVTAVVNAGTEPIHAEKIEAELVSGLRGPFRYDFSDEGQTKLKMALNEMRVPALGDAGADKLEFIRPTLKQLSTEGVNAAVLAELNRDEDQYRLRLFLITTARTEVAYQVEEKVDTAYSLDAFARAAKLGLAKLLRGIPFDATVISRDGYRVVLDRGKGTLTNGMQIPAFTIELNEGNIVYEETGVIAVTRVEENLSFGRILVEKKPREIATGNKIRLTDRLVADFNPDLLPEEHIDRAPAMVDSEFEVTKGQLGRVNADFGWNLIGYRNEFLSGGTEETVTGYPTANLEGELWFTSRFYMDLGYRHSVSRFANNQSSKRDEYNTTSTAFRLQFGYRVNILAPEPGPILYTKIGYGRESYDFESLPNPIYTGIAYGGIMLTGGMKVPMSDQWGMGLEINTLVFPSVAEQPFTSGRQNESISAWDVTLRSYYSLAKDMDVDLRAVIHNSNTGYTGGRGSRPVALKSYSQSIKALQFGLSYYF